MDLRPRGRPSTSVKDDPWSSPPLSPLERLIRRPPSFTSLAWMSRVSLLPLFWISRSRQSIFSSPLCCFLMLPREPFLDPYASFPPPRGSSFFSGSPELLYVGGGLVLAPGGDSPFRHRQTRAVRTFPRFFSKDTWLPFKAQP